jgi:hypothetical protein
VSLARLVLLCGRLRHGKRRAGTWPGVQWCISQASGVRGVAHASSRLGATLDMPASSSARPTGYGGIRQIIAREESGGAPEHGHSASVRSRSPRRRFGVRQLARSQQDAAPRVAEDASDFRGLLVELFGRNHVSARGSASARLRAPNERCGHGRTEGQCRTTGSAGNTASASTALGRGWLGGARGEGEPRLCAFP